MENVCSNGDAQLWRFCDDDARSRGDACKSVSASVLLRKLRWSTLGLQFDWSKVTSHSLVQVFAGSVFLCLLYCGNVEELQRISTP